jgi:hypothetical protein
MAWPHSQDYNEAIQNLSQNFQDPELRQGEAPVDDLGLPRPCSGNFADVYEVRCPAGGNRWAVKCFTREVRERYAAVCSHLEQARLPFAVDFQFLDQGVRIHGQWYPIVKMRWVEGRTLNQFVRDSLDKPALLDGLLQIWVRMAKRLHPRQAGLVCLGRRNLAPQPAGERELARPVCRLRGRHLLRAAVPGALQSDPGLEAGEHFRSADIRADAGSQTGRPEKGG